MEFCNNLRALIEERNITQKQLAIDLNMAPSTIGGYVQGSSQPDFETLKILADYFDVSSDYLLGIKTKGSNTSLESELLRIFRSMTSQQQLIFIEQGKVFIRTNIDKEKSKLP